MTLGQALAAPKVRLLVLAQDLLALGAEPGVTDQVAQYGARKVAIPFLVAGACQDRI